MIKAWKYIRFICDAVVDCLFFHVGKRLAGESLLRDQRLI